MIHLGVLWNVVKYNVHLSPFQNGTKNAKGHTHPVKWEHLEDYNGTNWISLLMKDVYI